MLKVKNIFLNLFLAVFSILFFFIILEVFVFRFILIAPDMPKLDFVNGIVKYKPGQTGIYRIRNEIEAEFRINKNGWNSAYGEYSPDKSGSRYRIAVVGDSYIEGMEVDYDESMAEKLESRLGSESFEVYRFGISGAPLSQYLHMIREEVMQYNPDMIIVVAVHNDFLESYKYLRGSYASNFMKLKIDGESVSETAPVQFVRPWYTFIRDSATWRYLAYRQKVPYHYLKNMLLGNKVGYNDYQANISLSEMNENRLMNGIAAEYVLNEIKGICAESGTDLLVVMNGVMDVVYNIIDKDESSKNGALTLNAMVNDIAVKNGIEFIDMETLFEKDFRDNGKRFTFINDGHWNEYGHGFVADAVYRYIQEQQTRF